MERTRSAGTQLNRLGDLPDAMSPFMGGSAVAMGPWLDANRDVAVRFIRAYQRAQEYVLDPANQEEVLGLLQQDMGHRRLAEQSDAVLVEAGEGLIPDASIDRQGLYGTASLRDQFGGFDTPQNLEWLTTPASGVFDLGPWLEASAPRGEALGHPAQTELASAAARRSIPRAPSGRLLARSFREDVRDCLSIAAGDVGHDPRTRRRPGEAAPSRPRRTLSRHWPFSEVT